MQEKKNSKQKIVVVGDVWVDNVLVPTPWQKGNKLAAFNLPGGALLIRDMLKALPHKTNNFEIISYPEKDMDKLSNQDIIISISEGEKVKDKKAPGKPTISKNHWDIHTPVLEMGFLHLPGILPMNLLKKGRDFSWQIKHPQNFFN